MSKDWTSGWRTNRRVGRRLCVMSSGIGPEGSKIALRRSDVVEVNMPIGQYVEGEDDTPKGRTKHWMNQWYAG